MSTAWLCWKLSKLISPSLSLACAHTRHNYSLRILKRLKMWLKKKMWHRCLVSEWSDKSVSHPLTIELMTHHPIEALLRFFIAHWTDFSVDMHVQALPNGWGYEMVVLLHISTTVFTKVCVIVYKHQRVVWPSHGKCWLSKDGKTVSFPKLRDLCYVFLQTHHKSWGLSDFLCKNWRIKRIKNSVSHVSRTC